MNGAAPCPVVRYGVPVALSYAETMRAWRDQALRTGRFVATSTGAARSSWR